MTTRTAVVTVFQGRHDHLRLQQRSLSRGSVRPDLAVLVAMDDQPPPADADNVTREVLDQPVGDALPLAAARNRGVEYAIVQGADVVILLDVDVLAGPELVSGYKNAVARRPDTIWSGPVTYLAPPPSGGYQLCGLSDLDSPHPARPAPDPGVFSEDAEPDLFWSLSFALGPKAWRSAGGFCEDYVGYGGEDTDFGHQAVANGVGLGWAGSPRGYHQFHPTADPPVHHLDDILRNAAVYHRRWGQWPMQGWLRAFCDQGLIEQQRHGQWVRADR